MTMADLYQDQSLSIIEIKEEIELLSCYTQSIKQAGVTSDLSSIVNFYVSLKSRPLVILSGPQEGQKDMLIRCLARLLFGEGSYQCQMLIGHPWWANQGNGQSFLTQMHTRYNSEKVIETLEEAAQPENYRHVFLTNLIQISPSELLSFFADLGIQVQRQELIRFGDIHLPEPIPYPPNMFLIGTMDIPHFDAWSPNLLSGVAVIHWTKQNPNLPSNPLPDESLYSGENIFLKSCIRDISAAYRHLHKVLGSQQHTPFEPFFEIKLLIERYHVILPPQVISDVIIYLANAWSIDGDGLFNSKTSRNFEIALDYAIAQFLLPWIVLDPQKSTALYDALKDYCLARFPVAYEQLFRLA